MHGNMDRSEVLLDAISNRGVTAGEKERASEREREMGSKMGCARITSPCDGRRLVATLHVCRLGNATGTRSQHQEE